MRVMSIEQKIRFRTFSDRVISLFEKYEIKHDKYASTLQAQRLARLFSIELIKILGAQIGVDAECAFYEYAVKKKLTCSELPVEVRARKRKKKYKKLVALFPSTYRRVFEDLNFDNYLRLIDVALLPDRVPLLERSPVCRMKKPKKL